MRRKMDDLVSNAEENNGACVDSGSDESEDVKVCDICGDVGEEKKLAVCSRCNDGAEHIYCMRVMIPEVPEGDWLCEECQADVQIKKEKNTLEISQAKVNTICTGGNMKAANVGNLELNEEDKGNDKSRKRTKEDTGIIGKPVPGTGNVCCAPVPNGCISTGNKEDGSSCVAGGEAANDSELGYGHQQTSNGRNTVSNFKVLEGERHNLRGSNDVPCSSEVDVLSCMTLKNKSSTMSETKRSEEVEDVKVCDICGDVGAEEKLAVCGRCSDGAEHTYCMRVMMQEVPKDDWLCETCHNEVENEKRKTNIETSELKVGGFKGQSFVGPINKSVNTANSSSSKNVVVAETMGSKVSDRGYEMNCGNKRKDGDAGITSLARQNPLSRESSFKLDTNKGKNLAGHISTTLTCNSLKNQKGPLRGQLSKSTSFNNSKVPKVKQLLNELTQKPKTLKDSLSCPTRKEGPMGILAKSASFKKPRSFEPVNKAKLSTVNPLVSENARNDILTSILGSSSLTGSVAVPVHSKAQSSAQHLNKGNKMADSNTLGTSGGEGARNFLGHSGIKKPLHTKGPADITLSSAGMLGPGAQRKTIQVPDSSHRDDQIKSPHSLVPSNSSRNVSIPGTASLRDNQTVPSLRGRSVDSISATSNNMQDKKIMFYSEGFPLSSKHIASTIPELDYSWRGDFELLRTGRSPVLFEGLQAHLPCSASPKVLEVAKKFPSNIQLEELPRQNVWPPQFHANGPTIDSIGLFFFARDTQCYEIHYSKLVESLLKDDLALRGNIETAELLIFSSNTLPNNFQRWNMFHFLWGVFRVRRKDSLNVPPDLPINDNVGSNGVKSLFHPLGGNHLEGQSHDSITARFQTNKSSAVNDSLPVPTKKSLKLAYSEQKEKMGYPSEDGCDIQFDYAELNTCSVSPIHEKVNNSTTIKMDNAKHLMDGGNVDTISHVLGGLHKRNVEVANWDDKVNGRPQHKRIKLDDGGSVCPG
ncbi:uncharacterized protein LOC102709889 isoform X1 [Oryza brachyantha]|uniref:uncharacterized protein LOC102709889 isoform X1 n=1 Tax=Oryza brachyantha TaxID=4533 RepID=UPI0003EADD9D|nr:uncharacterized protein LOC102709889 isoform X1 [Oryza brachyantha]XP_040385318.1 uncharacterized protein LOC102709889 isoform X1 [Oryza brachyantha]XP_040385319.1 uncharacterized protein LOC102709889 isoform X1 [Oryza brachyantha]XP_040385320.1 uncharacterized protein LOC102709889 isoform X1 [Oryza brachyantha]